MPLVADRKALLLEHAYRANYLSHLDTGAAQRSLHNLAACPDWWYLAPDSGQHVFFYSQWALQLIARTHGYELAIGGGYLLFLRRGVCGALTKVLARALLRSGMRRITRARLAMSCADGAWRDHLLHVERAKSRSLS